MKKYPEISGTITVTMTNQTLDYSILRLPIILAGFFMLTLVSACAGSNPAPTNAAQGGGGRLPTTPTNVSSAPVPQAPSVPGAQINAAAFAPSSTGQEPLIG